MRAQHRQAHLVCKALPRSRRSFGRLTGVGVALVALAGCELTSTQPDVTVPGSIQDSTALPTIAAGALGDFAGAFGGFGNTTPGVILLGGTLGDEWINSDYFDTHSQVENRE